MPVKLFVGFGGTGGKVLTEFARLVADDAELADEGDRSFYFLLVDTDRRDLSQASRAIESHFKRVPGCRPVIETLDLAENVDRLTDLVDRLIVDSVVAPSKESGFETDALKVARKHWYFRSSGSSRAAEPFAARRLPRPIREGAGQCPLAGHFAAWFKLDKLSEVLGKLKGQMLNRQNEGEGVDVYLTGSLAGGTGRGCWPLLSLKAREVFGKTMFTGLFADASVFEREVSELEPRFRYRLHVNSLTGLSEISGWIRNDLGNDSPRFPIRLPHVKALGTGDFAIDSDKWARPGTVGRGLTPIDHAYVVTRGSDSLEFRSIGDVYRMMGAALFSHTATGQLQSRLANEEQFGSVGVGIIRVPIVDLRDTMAMGVAASATESLLQTDAAAVTAAVAALTDPFAFQGYEVADGTAGQLDERSFLGTCAERLKDGVDVGSVVSLLEDNQSLPEVEAQVNADQFADERERDVAAAARTALLDRMRRKGATDPLAEFKAMLAERLRASLQDERSPGIGTAEQILSQLRRRLSELQAHVGQWESIKLPTKPALRAKLMESVRERAGRSVPVFGKRWDEQERSEIASQMRTYALEANFKVLVRHVHGILGDALQAIAEFEHVVMPVHRRVASHAKSLRDQYLSMESRTFLPEGDAALLKTIDDWHSTTFKLHRRLLPSGSAAILAELEDGALKSRPYVTARNQVLSLVADRLEGRSGLASLERQTAWSDEVIAMVDQQLLPRVATPRERLLEVFRIERVIGSIEARFRRYLDLNVAAEAEVERVQDYFESFFGQRFVRRREANRDTNQFTPIPARELMLQMCYALAQQTDPMVRTDWRDKDGGNVLDKVTVFLPRQAALVNDDEWKRLLDEAKSVGERDRSGIDAAGSVVRSRKVRPVERYTVSEDLDTHFTIVAYASHSIKNFTSEAFDGVQSFDSWREDPHVTEWLRRCEAEDIGSPESGVWSEADGNVGLGYLFPFFVTDPGWRRLRWAPWASSPAMAASKARDLDALLYAMVGNLGGALAQSTDSFVADARKVIEAVNAHQPDSGRNQRWTMPLLVRSETSGDLGWTLQRKCFRREGGGSVSAVGGQWSPGARFQTLRELIKRFGIGSANLTEEGQDFVRAVTEERMLLVGKVIPAIDDVAGAGRRDHVNAALKTFLDAYCDGYLRSRPEEQRSVEQPVLDQLRSRVDSRQFRWDAAPGMPGT